ncbi:hypothetical protein VE25_20505 [Devosia geojensis]|uniref:YdeI/OmpD-associated family protein n=1 Tax=Devosia geojensis TaxID=443610 RepID=A0A0F5FDD1_9HYPH|nr:YdeI/OmpD-associated family protein [Devosia geojensis]KKB06861.1 hypothetical protein VE25_20505 [Devosia geojensis]
MTTSAPSSENLKRALQPMPADIGRLLKERHLERAYEMRPAYQRNDYLGWIARAKRADTRQKRIDQMLDELARGDAYMKMEYNGPRE